MNLSNLESEPFSSMTSSLRTKAKRKQRTRRMSHGWIADRIKMSADAEATVDEAALEKVLAIIKELHSDGTQEVAFVLQHLYRRASISGFSRVSEGVRCHPI